MPISGEVRRGLLLVTKLRKAILNKESSIELPLDPSRAPDSFVYDDKKLSIDEWFNRLLSLGLKDAKLFIPKVEEGFELIGVDKFRKIGVIIFLKDKSELLEIKCDLSNDKWQYNFVFRGEVSLPDIRFENKVEEYKQVLIDIGNFAVELGCPGWKNDFMEAHDVLDGKIDIESGKHASLNEEFSYLSEELRRMIIASGIADVFGGMGSWNDSAAYLAGETPELMSEYNRLSHLLFYHVNHHFMFVANESYKK